MPPSHITLPYTPRSHNNYHTTASSSSTPRPSPQNTNHVVSYRCRLMRLDCPPVRSLNTVEATINHCHGRSTHRRNNIVIINDKCGWGNSTFSFRRQRTERMQQSTVGIANEIQHTTQQSARRCSEVDTTYNNLVGWSKAQTQQSLCKHNNHK